MEGRAEAVAFCQRMRPQLVGALSLYCGDVHLAEELAQEALAKVWNHWGHVRTMGYPEAWAHRVAVNFAKSTFRRRAAEQRMRRRVEAQLPQPDTGDDPADRLAVREAVTRLPHRQRAALVLRYYAELPIAEVAVVMNCSPRTVKSLTHKAILALRERGGLLPEVFAND